MSWTISFSRSADKFLQKNDLDKEDIFGLVKVAVRKFSGEVTNLDIKKLKGEWEGHYRIRKGDLRIIVFFDFERSRVLIEEIDWRGNAYKE